MLNIGRISGIPLKIHWSFGLLILYVIYISYSFDLTKEATLGFGLLLVCLFIFVILHELGHAFAARYYGIDTHDIIISPLGGLARLQDLPEKPWHELVVAFAGPAVNLVLATSFGLILSYVFHADLVPMDDDFALLMNPIEFMKFMFAINIILFLFNLLPAFPMDGGRILRALLAIKLDRVLATRIAMWIGRAMAFLFVFIAIQYEHITWGFIGLFVFVMAGQEYRQVVFNDKAKEKVKTIMRSQFTKIYDYQYFSHLLPDIGSSSEKNFVVFNELDHIIGALPELYIQDAIKSNITNTQVREHMSHKVAVIHPDSTIGQLTQMMKDQGISICAVKDHDILGVIGREDVERWYRS